MPRCALENKIRTSNKFHGKQRKRLGMIEPVFGNITVNKGMNKFTLRGKGHKSSLKPSIVRSAYTSSPQSPLSPIVQLMIENMNNLNYCLHMLKI